MNIAATNHFSRKQRITRGFGFIFAGLFWLTSDLFAMAWLNANQNPEFLKIIPFMRVVVQFPASLILFILVSSLVVLLTAGVFITQVMIDTASQRESWRNMPVWIFYLFVFGVLSPLVFMTLGKIQSLISWM